MHTVPRVGAATVQACIAMIRAPEHRDARLITSCHGLLHERKYEHRDAPLTMDAAAV